MNADDLAKLFPNSSADFLALNHTASGLSPPKLERAPGDEPLGKNEIEAKDSGKYVVRITSYRRRLIDVDNLAEKYHVDALRYAGILPSDAPNKCSIFTSQVKVKTKEEELTEITIDIPI